MAATLQPVWSLNIHVEVFPDRRDEGKTRG
jgi:hypothetical protein